MGCVVFHRTGLQSRAGDGQIVSNEVLLFLGRFNWSGQVEF